MTTLAAGRDDDTLDGAAGRDTLRAGAGDDVLLGHGGSDRLNGETGDDTAFGGDGWDRLVGDYGADRLFGGASRDTLWGGAGRDRLDGGAGDDTLAGGSNPDRLVGGAGDDVLEGAHGNDRLWGDGVTTAATTASGGEGNDVAVYTGARAGYGIETVDGITFITDLDPTDGDDGTDRLEGVERARFADGTEVRLETRPGVFELSGLDGQNGFVINGVTEGDSAGSSVSAAGDINGDGIDDLIIGAPGADASSEDAGASYVVFGSRSRFPATLELSALDGSNGFVISGENATNEPYDGGDFAGIVSGAGDINGDGLDDLIIGAPGADPHDFEAGSAYIVFGTLSGFGPSLDRNAVDGSNGFQINGVFGAYTEGQFGDRAGSSVSGAGDINGDGLDDLIIGAAYTSDATGYVVFGSSSNFAATVELALLDGSNGFAISGGAGYYSGHVFNDAGDINGDGIDDLIVGRQGAYSYLGYSNYRTGASYVIFGAASGFNAQFDLWNLDGSNGFVMNGIGENGFFGASVSGAGDVNGDGIDDLIIGATGVGPGEGRFDSNGSGASYVVFGSRAAYGTTLDLTTLDGSNGFVINGVAPGDASGTSVAGAGDVNGDGIDDLIIGATGVGPSDSPYSYSGSGATYVVFGSGAGFAAALDLATLDGSNGFVVYGIGAGDASGSSVAAAGDINGDGIDDLIIGAPYADPNGYDSGAAYVVFGSAAGFAASLDVATLPPLPGLAAAAPDAMLL